LRWDRHLQIEPGHPPNSIAYALNTLADWQLKYHQDPEAARETLERVQQMLPGTEYANLAAQRIAHLGGVEMQLAAHEPRTIHMNVAIRTLGSWETPRI